MNFSLMFPCRLGNSSLSTQATTGAARRRPVCTSSARFSRRTECDTIAASLGSRPNSTTSKELLDDSRGCDEIPATTESRPNAGQMVIQVGREKSSSLNQGRSSSAHDECHEQKQVGQIFGLNLDDEERDHPVGVVLGESVGDGHDERIEEEICAEEVASQSHNDEAVEDDIHEEGPGLREASRISLQLRAILVQEVRIEYDSHLRARYEEGRDRSPYLRQQSEDPLRNIDEGHE